MENNIPEKLVRISELFPAERLEKSRSRLTGLWNGEKPMDRIPFTLSPIYPAYYTAGRSAAQQMEELFNEFMMRGEFEDDFIPALFPGCHQGTIPSMFGAEEVVVDGDYSCKHIIESISEVDKIPEAAIIDGSPAKFWLEMQTEFKSMTNGKLPIHVTDMQGPFDVAAQLLGYDALFVAKYEDHKSYDKLLLKTTEAFISYWRMQETLLRDLFVGTHLWAWSWVPPGIGATVSVDSLVMFSPDFYADAVKPYLELIGERLGGLVTHSCGNFSGVIPELCRTKGLRGVNSSQMSLQELIDAGLTPDKVAVIMVPYEKLEETVELMLSKKQAIEFTVTGVWPDSKPELWNKDVKNEIHEKCRKIDKIMRNATASIIKHIS